MGAFQSMQIHPHLVKLLPAGFKREGESATHEAGPLCPVMSLYLRPFPPTRPSSRAAFVARSTHVWLCPLLCCLPHKLVSLVCFPVTIDELPPAAQPCREWPAVFVVHEVTAGPFDFNAALHFVPRSEVVMRPRPAERHCYQRNRANRTR